MIFIKPITVSKADTDKTKKKILELLKNISNDAEKNNTVASQIMDTLVDMVNGTVYDDSKVRQGLRCAVCSDCQHYENAFCGKYLCDANPYSDPCDRIDLLDKDGYLNINNIYIGDIYYGDTLVCGAIVNAGDAKNPFMDFENVTAEEIAACARIENSASAEIIISSDTYDPTLWHIVVF
jgi:hypothetical protein